MVKALTFDIRYDNDLAHQYYGDGEKLVKLMRDTYKNQNLEFPDEYDSTSTYPPINFMNVTAKDDVDVDGLRGLPVPSGLTVEIIDFDEE